MRNKLENNPIV